MKKLNIKYISLTLVVVVTFFGLNSCTDNHLNYQPRGAVTIDQLQDTAGVELLVTAAYAALGNDDAHANAQSYSTNWVWGSVRSDDAYKGGAGQADQQGFDRYERFAFISVDQPKHHDLWKALFDGVARANLALSVINDREDYQLKTQREAEMRFVRAHFYFRLVQLFKYVPWVDESTDIENAHTISNREFTHDQLLDMIAAEFQFALDNLPDTQEQIGRANAVAAAAYKAKTRLYQAYEQDEQHNVVNINDQRLEEVIDLTNYVIDSGKHSLHDDYAKNFLPEFENGTESVFAIQYSRDDGTAIGRLNMSHNLNYSMAPEYGCCSFHQPSQNLINAFQTNSDGLPLFDTFNDEAIDEPSEYQSNSFDPRIDHTIGIDGHPFKYDPNFKYQSGWARAPEIYGAHNAMKEIEHPDSPALRAVGSRFGSSRNQDIIRYDDVLLWKAEALIELVRQDEALPIINSIRERAVNSTDRLRLEDGTAPTNYNIETYQPGQNINWTQENAREALRWERRMEFATESPRFFDLVRWEMAAETLNDYFEVERTRHSFLQDANFQKNQHEYLPIPQQEIVLSEGAYQQNPGY